MMAMPGTYTTIQSALLWLHGPACHGAEASHSLVFLWPPCHMLSRLPVQRYSLHFIA